MASTSEEPNNATEEPKNPKKQYKPLPIEIAKELVGAVVANGASSHTVSVVTCALYRLMVSKKLAWRRGRKSAAWKVVHPSDELLVWLCEALQQAKCKPSDVDVGCQTLQEVERDLVSPHDDRNGSGVGPGGGSDCPRDDATKQLKELDGKMDLVLSGLALVMDHMGKEADKKASQLVVSPTAVTEGEKVRSEKVIDNVAKAHGDHCDGEHQVDHGDPVEAVVLRRQLPKPLRRQLPTAPQPPPPLPLSALSQLEMKHMIESMSSSGNAHIEAVVRDSIEDLLAQRGCVTVDHGGGSAMHTIAEEVQCHIADEGLHTAAQSAGESLEVGEPSNEMLLLVMLRDAAVGEDTAWMTKMLEFVRRGGCVDVSGAAQYLAAAEVGEDVHDDNSKCIMAQTGELALPPIVIDVWAEYAKLHGILPHSDMSSEETVYANMKNRAMAVKDRYRTLPEDDAMRLATEKLLAMFSGFMVKRELHISAVGIEAIEEFRVVLVGLEEYPPLRLHGPITETIMRAPKAKAKNNSITDDMKGNEGKGKAIVEP